MAEGSLRRSRIDALLDRIEPPPLSSWAYAVRIWLAMMLALYAGF